MTLDINDDFYKYHSRNLPLSILGKDGLRDLREMRATVVGVGGLGTIIAEQLAACGIGKLRLIDQDFVEYHNLPRQKLYFVEDVGKSKAEAAAKYIKKRNPFVKIEVIHSKLTRENSFELLEGSNVVVDGTDNFETRRIINEECFRLEIPWVFGGALAETGNIMTITYKKDTPCFHCIFGEQSDDENAPTCETVGVYPPLLGLVANIQVTEAIRLLRDKQPVLESKLMVISTADLSFETIPVKKRKDCPVCGENPQYSGLVADRKREEVIIPDYGKVIITGLCSQGTFLVHPEHEFNWNFEEVVNKAIKKYSAKKVGDTVLRIELGKAVISLASTGVATIKGPLKIEEAKKIYSDIINELIS